MQKTMALSTAEAKYYLALAAGYEVLYLLAAGLFWTVSGSSRRGLHLPQVLACVDGLLGGSQHQALKGPLSSKAVKITSL